MRLIDADALRAAMYHEAFENDASYDEKNPLAKWDSGLWVRYKMFESCLESAPSIDAVPQWIPCSESLPEEYGNYLITTHDGNVDIGTIDPKKKSVWSACDADGFYWLREVVAWMPLPKLYKGEE